MKYLIIDGYTKAAREELAAGGASMAADLYETMLSRWTPGGAECVKLFPSDPGVQLPDTASLQQVDGVAWTGCSLSCTDDSPEVAGQIALQRRLFAAGVPCFGSCWAIQIAVVAAGGVVAANPRGREMGLARKIQLSPSGLGHPLHEGRRTPFDAFTSHDDEVTHLPAGAVNLSGNTFTRVQSLSLVHGGSVFWGVQYHPEYDLHEMARLTYCRIEKLCRRGFFRSRDDALAYIADLEALHQNPDRKDLAWKLGIDEDVMDESIRCTEVRNWIRHQVLPLHQTKS